MKMYTRLFVQINIPTTIETWAAFLRSTISISRIVQTHLPPKIDFTKRGNSQHLFNIILLYKLSNKNGIHAGVAKQKQCLIYKQNKQN